MDELEAGIRNEYVKNYLWTGDINEALYEVGFVSISSSLFGPIGYVMTVGKIKVRRFGSSI